MNLIMTIIMEKRIVIIKILKMVVSTHITMEIKIIIKMVST